MASSWAFHFVQLLALFSTAIPSVHAHDTTHHCLTDARTDAIVARWTSLAINIDPAVVNATVADDFRFFSDSQDFLEGLPPGSLTGVPSIAGKADLIAQQTAAQAPGAFVVPLNFSIMQTAHGCRTITFRWRFHAEASGTDPNSTNKKGDPIAYAGIDFLFLADRTDLIQTVYSEWNNGELLYDSGTRTCFQKDNASACS